MGEDLHTMAIVIAAIYYRMAPLKRLDAETNKSFFYSLPFNLFSILIPHVRIRTAYNKQTETQFEVQKITKVD